MIDDISFRRAIDSEIDADTPVEIDGAHGIRIAELLERGQCVFAPVFVIETVNRNDAGLGILDLIRMLFAARDAPGGPYV